MNKATLAPVMSPVFENKRIGPQNRQGSGDQV